MKEGHHGYWCAGGWRNGLLFDPAKKYGNFSYQEIMLNPLADALAQVATSSTKIYFAMQVHSPSRSQSTLRG